MREHTGDAPGSRTGLKVLWVSHTGKMGGAEQCLVEGVDALAELGHDSVVVVPAEGPLADLVRNRVPTYVLPHNPWAADAPRRRDATRWMAYNLLVARARIAAVAVRQEVDVVLSQTVVSVAGALAARAASLPHAWFLHEFGDRDHGLRFLLGTQPTLRAMRRLARVCLVNSKAVKAHYEGLLPGMLLRIVRYSVDATDPHRLGRVAAQRGGHAPFTLLLAGRKTPAKGQHEAVEALALVAARGIDVALDLVGDGEPEYERALKDRAARLGVADRLRLLPFTDDLTALREAADACLMCSRAEALGRVTIEAMKAGRPVVATAAGANPELIEHGRTGLLYEPGDVGALADHVAHLHSDRRGAEEMGRRAQTWATSEFNALRYGTDLEHALQEAIAVHGLTVDRG